MTLDLIISKCCILLNLMLCQAAQARESLKQKLSPILVRSTTAQIQQFRAAQLPPRVEYTVYVNASKCVQQTMEYNREIKLMFDQLLSTSQTMDDQQHNSKEGISCLE